MTIARSTPTWNWKEIDIAKLTKLLKQSGGKAVSTNPMGNLLVLGAKGEELGYIDMAKEDFVKFPP